MQFTQTEEDGAQAAFLMGNVKVDVVQIHYCQLISKLGLILIFLLDHSCVKTIQ
jgi:hypothetical protein